MGTSDTEIGHKSREVAQTFSHYGKTINNRRNAQNTPRRGKRKHKNC